MIQLGRYLQTVRDEVYRSILGLTHRGCHKYYKTENTNRISFLVCHTDWYKRVWPITYCPFEQSWLNSYPVLSREYTHRCVQIRWGGSDKTLSVHLLKLHTLGWWNKCVIGLTTSLYKVKLAEDLLGFVWNSQVAACGYTEMNMTM